MSYENEVVDMARTTAPRGTSDILPRDMGQWHQLEQKVRDVCAVYGYEEIRTPIFEHTELFARGIGEVTDIVEKEMYTFADRADRSLTLRPEGTAGVVRAYLEHRLDTEAQPVKMYYMGPMFRYERPQAGRARQFHQLGVETVGTMDPAMDAEVIALLVALLRSVGLDEFTVHINSIGCPGCRPAYVERLREALAPVQDELCTSCQQRFERSPLRILDCKRARCIELTQDVPVLTDALCASCAKHFEEVVAYLSELGLTHQLTPRLVRGFDYYTRTVFEVTSPVLGAQDALGGGGRYDGLVETLGGQPTPAVGFAAGMERILLAAAKKGGQASPSILDAYVVTLGEGARAVAVRTAAALRDANLKTELDYMDRSLRAQLRQANRLGARVAVIIGEEEVTADTVRIRDMDSGEERTIAAADVVQLVQQLRGG